MPMMEGGHDRHPEPLVESCRKALKAWVMPADGLIWWCARQYTTSDSHLVLYFSACLQIIAVIKNTRVARWNLRERKPFQVLLHLVVHSGIVSHILQISPNNSLLIVATKALAYQLRALCNHALMCAGLHGQVETVGLRPQPSRR